MPNGIESKSENIRDMVVVGGTLNDPLGPDGYKADHGMLVFIRNIDHPTVDGGYTLLDIGARGQQRDMDEHDLGMRLLLDDLPVSEFSDAIAALIAERNAALVEMEHAFIVDTSMSMSGSMLREVLADVSKIMGRRIDVGDAMEMLESPFAREAREESRLYTAFHLRDEIADYTPPFVPRNQPNGAPRSIRETMRAQGRGKKASAMRGWKRK